MSRQWHDAIKKLVGKKIVGVMVAESPDDPREQVFLFLDGGMHYELYGSDFWGIKNMGSGGIEEIRRQMENRKGAEIVVATSIDSDGLKDLR